MKIQLSVDTGSRVAAFGTKTYELSLTRNYVSRWGMVHAVRELIQNALDSDSPFVYEFAQETGSDTWTLSLVSEFTTLAPQTLLLGATSKSESQDSIGSFGEGYKIALLVLTRLGHDVEIRNGSLLWRPRFRHNAKFGEELLVIDETPLPNKLNKGLTFAVHGLSDADVTEIRSSCLKMMDSVGQVIDTAQGRILLEHPGSLYVGSLFVCKTDFKFGYDVPPKMLKLERDRQTVDGFDLKMLTKEIWFSTEQWDRIAQMIADEIPDVEYAEYGSPEMVKDACFRLFSAKHPTAVAAKSQEELKALVQQGMTKVVVINSAFQRNVTTSHAYRTQPHVRVPPPRERLEAWYEKARYDLADKHKAPFRELLEESTNWRLSS